MNALSINIPANFAADCNNTLKRYNAAQTDAERRAVLDRQTVQGLWWAIDFVSKLCTPLHERPGAETCSTAHLLSRRCAPRVPCLSGHSGGVYPRFFISQRGARETKDALNLWTVCQWSLPRLCGKTQTPKETH
nr:MAG TPA: hypothetical protein [Caudoviricetes sp.]